MAVDCKIQIKQLLKENIVIKQIVKKQLAKFQVVIKNTMNILSIYDSKHFDLHYDCCL